MTTIASLLTSCWSALPSRMASRSSIGIPVSSASSSSSRSFSLSACRNLEP